MDFVAFPPPRRHPTSSAHGRRTCNFNRDTGWGVLGPHGLEGVRQVAIDDDWTALRFRKVDYIKTMTRKFGALSEGGKAKTRQTVK